MSCGGGCGCAPCSGLSGLDGTLRELTNLEIDQFLARHPDVWDMVEANDRQLVYPGAGLAVLDPSGRYVLVWKDASGIWHYIDLADMTQMQTIANSTNAPHFVSDPDILGLIHDQLVSMGTFTFSFLVPALIIGAAIYFGRR